MDRDLLDLNVGTLDVIIYAVLATIIQPAIGLKPLRLSGTVAVDEDGFDAVATTNAKWFVEYYVGHPIQAIKAIREVSGLGLRDSKDAWEQAIESYYGRHEYNVAALRNAIDNGSRYDIEYYAGLIAR